MKATEFRASIDELYQRLIALTETKGEEYKRRADNQFANFERGALALGLTREQVLMVYLSKHLDSITTYVKDRSLGQDRVRRAHFRAHRRRYFVPVAAARHDDRQ